MAVAVFTRFNTLSPMQYDEVIASMQLDVDPPVGALLHIATGSSDAIEVSEIWRTRETFETYLDQRLRPALERHHVHGEPEVRIVPLHNLYIPDLDSVERMGAVSTAAVAFA